MGKGVGHIIGGKRGRWEDGGKGVREKLKDGVWTFIGDRKGKGVRGEGHSMGGKRGKGEPVVRVYGHSMSSKRGKWEDGEKGVRGKGRWGEGVEII